MLFYVKKHLALELLVALLLGSAGWLGARALDVPLPVQLDAHALVAAGLGALALIAWTLLVQGGYALLKGKAYTDELTRALASHFEHASVPQMLAGALAAAGEEVFFRGFVQGRFGLIAGAVAFMLAHIGRRDIRVIGYWSIFQGLLLGAIYAFSHNLLVPVVAHGLFDLGAMFHFRRLMARQPVAPARN